MITRVKPPVAKTKGRTSSEKKSRRASCVSQPAIVSATKCDPHFAATYAWALACIADADLKARVEAILVAASEITAATAKSVGRQLAKLAKKLHSLAVRSPAVAEALIVIVEHWGVGQRCLAIQALAAQVVGNLIMDDRLDHDQTASAVRGLAAAWCDINEKDMMDGSDGDETGAIAEFIFWVVLTPLEARRGHVATLGDQCLLSQGL